MRVSPPFRMAKRVIRNYREWMEGRRLRARAPRDSRLSPGAKIFCIGLNKTGTTSLHEAFRVLGIWSVHFACARGNIKKIIRRNQAAGRPLLKGIEKFQAYSDWNARSTNHLFALLDEQYPGSKFILNTRDLEAWIRSREKHVMRSPNLEQKREEHPDSYWYGLNREYWIAERNELHEAVFAHFRDRPDDLLVMDVPGGDGWDKLCPFLGIPIPDTPFPRQNQAMDQKRPS